MARRTTHTPPADRTLSGSEMRNGVERLARRLRELRQLDPRSVITYRSHQIVALETAIEETLAAIFGQGTPKFRRYKPACDLEPTQVLRMVPDWIAVRGGGGEHSGVDTQELQQGIADRQQQAVALLEQAIRGLEEEIAYRGEQTSPTITESRPLPSGKIFLVHGRDDASKNEVALFLRAIGLDPIILHLRPNGGRHLLTKFREEAEGASFAVVQMTPDDEGSVAGSAERQPRARQNVVFELGFFIGKLGPANVAALLKGEIEKPSDYEGIAYIKFDSGGQWKTNLARELHHAKVPFDPAKAFSA